MLNDQGASTAGESESIGSGAGAERNLAGALHDMANALTVVLGWIEIALREASAGERDDRSLQWAQQWARYGRGIALRAIGVETAVDANEDTDVGSLVRGALAGLRPQAEQRNVRLVDRTSEDTQRQLLAAWPIALQVLTNLLMNAVASSPPGAEVVVEGFREPTRVRLVVRDRGPGIDAKLQARWFEGIPSSHHHGSGIGLRHSYALARSCGGSLTLLEAQSGTCFELGWPTASSTPPARVSDPTLRRLVVKRVLVLEDDPAVLMLLETGLEARGADVVSVPDSVAFCEALAAQRFDAALADLSALGTEAGETFRRIRGDHPGVCLILVSGSATPPSGVLETVTAWVRKPFEVSEILDAMADESAG